MFSPEYEKEFLFFLDLIRQSNLPVNILVQGSDDTPDIDLGIRRQVYPSFDKAVAANDIFSSVEKETVYRITDEFLCCYIAFKLPGTSPETVVCIGPYTNTDFSVVKFTLNAKKQALHPEWYGRLEKYHSSLLYIPDERQLLISVNTIAERLWKDGFQTKLVDRETFSNSDVLFSSPLVEAEEYLEADMKLIEYRYEAEQRFMEAISKGRVHKAIGMLSAFTPTSVDVRSPEPTRNVRNYLIILNTIMRKAAQQGAVHPLHIHRASTVFAKKIETIRGWDDVSSLCTEMAQTYCDLVNNHSVKGYSSLVQKVVSRIDFDLTADLSLKATAAALGLNASYLSSAFKKETSYTLTDYVGKKRAEYAVFLLRNTNLSVSAIGQQCGISDNNYFTKLFKKYTGKTPLQVRNEEKQI